MASEQPVSEPPPPPPPQGPPSPLRVSAPEPAVKLTRGHSCVLCQQRKVRCDKQKPCANCVKAQVECRVVPPQPPRRRKKKPHERDLIERLRKYESLLSQAGVDFEPIGQQFKPMDLGDDIADLEQDLIALKASPSSSNDHVSPAAGGRGKQTGPSNIHQYRGSADDDSSDEEHNGPTIHNAFDTMFGSGDGFPFMVGGAPASVTSAHPSPIQMFQLWQVYISNVNPLLKITHTPTLQADIISASANPSKISRPLEALMFAIYFSAVTSLTEDEVQTMFGEDRSILLGRYHNATQQALVNAEFMKSTELAVLQAFFLYLLSARPFVDPRSLYTLLGLAFRIATRLNLHRDGIDSNMPPFEVEQRRRLWWQIVVFDKRIAEITGSAMTILSSGATTTRLPLNINDSDLNIQAKVPPASYAGPTEMTFALTRIELTVAACPDSVRQSVSTPGGGPIQKPMVHYDNHSPSSTDVISHVTNQHLPNDLAAFCAYMENVYLKQCDTKVPLQYFTILMTRQNLCKLRIIDFLCRSANSDNISQAERDSYFLEALRMIEYDNLLQSAESIKGFRWYTYAHFPLPGYLCLVSELRHRTTGELCERAWDVMIENHERRGLLRRLNRNPLHIAFGRYLVKAWDAREAAELQNGRILETPQVVQLLRNALGMSAKLTAPPQQPQPQQQHQQPQDPSQYPPRHPSASAGMSNAPVPHAIHPQPGISPHTSSLASAAPTPNPGGMPTAVGMNNMAVSSVGRAPTSMYSSPANPAMAQSSNTPPQLHPQHSQPSLTSAGGGSAMGGNLMVADDDPAGGSAATAAMMYAASYESTPTPTQGAGMFGSGSGSVPGGGGGGGSGGGMPGQDQPMPPVMDWDYLVQMTSLGGFNAAGYYGGGGI